MNEERLLDVYEQISEAPDAIARLRRFVLDLAVRGKLVEQDAGDEPASALMKAAKAIQDEEGIKIKVDPLPPSETPFQAPLGWLWTRVVLIALQTGSGSTPRGGKSAYADEGTPFLRSQNIYDDGLRLDDVVFINDETNQKMKRTQVKAKDLLLNITGGSIGRCTRVPDEFAGANVSQHVAIIRTAAPGTEDYLHLLVRSPFFQEYVVGEQTGAGRGGLPKNRMDRIPVPLPPLAEQHRIVVKVDELMALCDRLEEARKTREEVRDKLTAASLVRLTAPDASAEDFPTHAAFALEALPALTTRPDQIKTLRQTILNLAVRGKLVEQDTADEPAAELLDAIAAEQNELAKAGKIKRPKPLPPVDTTLAPFDLPLGWSWARFPELGAFGRGKSKHRPRNDPALYRDGNVPFIQTGDVARSGGRITSNTGFYNEVGLAQSMLWPRGTMCITIAANIADSGILDFDACFPDSVVGLVPASMFDNARYFEYFIRTAKANLLEFAPATAQKNINLGILETVLIPLPPLTEQHRIVAKVDALMALCDRMEAALTTAETTRTRLLEALLHEALEPTTDTLEAAE